MTAPRAIIVPPPATAALARPSQAAFVKRYPLRRDEAVRASSGANAGVVVGPDGVGIIDSFASVDAARQLLAAVRQITKLPLKFVINTHYHLDHVAGNSVFAQAGAMLIAQRHVRDWIHAENLRLVTEGMAAEHLTMTHGQQAFIEGFVAPTVVYEDGIDLYLGPRRLEARRFPGHTGSDSVVHGRSCRVTAMSVTSKI